jgi:ribosomal protein L3 glutamine methyltransferase
MDNPMSNYFSAATQNLHTLRDWLRFAVSRFNHAGLFFGHGSSDAYDEAAYLILHTLHLPLDRLEPFFDARLTDMERAEVLSIIQRRVEQRIPAAYLTHEAFLGEFSFYVDERDIVPRSFIAELLLDQLPPLIA